MSCSYTKTISDMIKGKSSGLIPLSPPLIPLRQPINWGYMILGLAIWIGIFLLSAWILQLIWNGVIRKLFRSGSILEMTFVQALAIRFGLGLFF